jgi:hypothetical protein
MADRDIVLDAAKSVDPDDPQVSQEAVLAECLHRMLDVVLNSNTGHCKSSVLTFVCLCCRVPSLYPCAGTVCAKTSLGPASPVLTWGHRRAAGEKKGTLIMTGLLIDSDSRVCCETAILLLTGIVLPCRWEIPAGLLTGVEKLHTFTATVSKGTGANARTAKATLQIRPRDPALPIPTGVLTRDCGGSCSARHIATQPLSVSLQLDQKDTESLRQTDKQVDLTWSLDPPGPTPLVVPASSAVASATKNGQVQLVVPRSALPNAAAVTVSVKLTIPGQEGSGAASLVVPLNSPPVLKSPLEVILLGSENSFGKAAFRLSAAGMVDDEELT